MTRRRLHTILFGIAVAGALGFGTTQAVASPQEEEAALKCDPVICRRDCINRGFLDGLCINDQCWCNAGR